MEALTVRVAEAGERAELEAALPSGANDVHGRFLARQAAGEVTYLVARLDGRPVGTGVVRWSGRDGEPRPELSNGQVAEPARGRGAGTALIRYAEDLLRERGWTEAVLRVGEDNPRAAALYERLGYVDSGLRSTVAYSVVDAAGVEHRHVDRERVLTRRL